MVAARRLCQVGHTVPVDRPAPGAERSRWPLLRGLCATATFAFLPAACSGDDRSVAESVSTSVGATQAEQLAAQLDCAAVRNADDDFKQTRWAFTESLDCWVDGRPSIRIHSFDAASASEVSRGLRSRYTGNPCPVGELARQLVVVGHTWAVVTTRPDLRDLVVDRLGGTAVQVDDDTTTPVSYVAVDPCPDEPPLPPPG